MQKSLVGQRVFGPVVLGLRIAEGPWEPLWEPLSSWAPGAVGCPPPGVDWTIERVYGRLPMSNLARARVAEEETG
jgi:hypothetical protein